MRGEFIVIPVAASGYGFGGFVGILCLFGIAGNFLEEIQDRTSIHGQVQTVQVNKIINNQATVSIGIYGPYLECSHSPNVTIRPIASDKAQIHYKNNRFSWHFYNHNRRINNEANFYLIYHDSPHGQVELLCKGRGWNGGTGAIKFVLLPPHNEIVTTTQENDPFASDVPTSSDVPIADPNSEASILQQQAEAAPREEAVLSEPPIEAQETSATNETVEEELIPTPEMSRWPEQPLRRTGKLSSEELERITLIEMQKMRDGH